MTLKDPFNRPATNLRVSLTPACNLRCIYCHAEGEVSPEASLSAPEIARIMQVAKEFEFRSIKFTGGEPLLRKDVLDIVRSVPDGLESSMTTNGTLLAPLAPGLVEAGLSRVNVSLDSLDHETYRAITGKDCLDAVLEGIDAALDAGLTPVKLNMVVLKGVNEHEIDDFIRFVKGNRNLVLQLIRTDGAERVQLPQRIERARAAALRAVDPGAYPAHAPPEKILPGGVRSRGGPAAPQHRVLCILQPPATDF